MADTKISALPASTTPLAGTEVLPIVQSSTTKQVSVANLTAGRSFDALGMTLTSTDAGAAAAPLLELYRDSATPAASDTLGEIEFNGEDSAGNKQTYGVIHGSILSPTSTAEQGQLHFETATAGTLTEKMIIGTTNLVINEIGAVFNVRIEGDTDANLLFTDATNDRVGVGTLSPAYKLDVAGTAASQLRLQNSDATSYASMLFTGTGRSFSMGVGNASETGIGVANQFYIYDITAAQTRLRLDSNGGLKVSNTIGVGNTAPSTSGAGITFPATQSASTDANTLDDYEEGTWTPVLQFDANTQTITINQATYVKVGRSVTINMQISWSAKSGSGRVFITGLPFAKESGGTIALLAGCPAGSVITLAAIFYNVDGGGTTLNFAEQAGDISSVSLASAGSLFCSGTYFV